jgi:hypothetical protein
MKPYNQIKENTMSDNEDNINNDPADMSEVTLNLGKETLAQLAIFANDHDITISEALTRILKESVPVDFSEEDDEDDAITQEVIDSVADMCINGITVDTVHRYGNAYNVWFEEGGCDGQLITELIQKGFDLADNIMDEQPHEA